MNVFQRNIKKIFEIIVNKQEIVPIDQVKKKNVDRKNGWKDN